MSHDDRRSLEALAPDHLRYWLRAVGSKASMEEATAALKKDPRFPELMERWDRTAGEDRRAAVQEELTHLARDAAYATRAFCIRCGTCCAGAGPTLYPGDRALVRGRVLLRARLITLRRGEEVFSRHADRRIALERECVMIAPAPGGGCPMLAAGGRECTIHDRRPAQCRAQQCWDTAEADALIRTPGLSRAELLEPDDPLAAIIEDHEAACSVSRALELASRAETDPKARRRLSTMKEADARFRQEVLTGGLARPAELGFLFGRPLADLLAARRI